MFFDRQVKHYMCVQLKMCTVDEWADLGGGPKNRIPDMLIYFDGCDVLDEADWLFLKNWFEQSFFMGRMGFGMKSGMREKYLVITTIGERKAWEEEFREELLLNELVGESEVVVKKKIKIEKE